MTSHHLDELDGCIKARVVQLELVLEAIAHQVEAAQILPVRQDWLASGQQGVKGLALQLQTVSRRLQHQKLALDFLRGKRAGSVADMPGEVWQEWVLPIIKGLLSKGQTFEFSGDVLDPIALPLSHAVAIAIIAIDEQMDEAAPIHMWLRRDEQRDAIEIRFGAPLDTLVLDSPSVVVSAWGGDAAKIEVTPGELHISGPFRAD